MPHLSFADEEYLRSRGPMLGLNFDVWCSILRNCDKPRTVSLLSRTCRDLHTPGIYELLRRGVVVQSASQLEQFARFLDAHPERCARHIKCIFLWRLSSVLRDSREFSPTVIAKVLEHCTSVEDLSIEGTMILDKGSQVAAALAGLEHIKHIELAHIPAHGQRNDDWLSIAASMRSRCTSIKLTAYGSDPCLPITRVPPTISLGAFTSSLLKLDTTWAFDRMSMVPSELPVYPRLTTLTIHPMDEVRMEPLLASFPALRSLSVLFTYDSWSRAMDPVADRSRNVAAWQAAPNPWRELEYVECHTRAAALFRLGIACPVRRALVYPTGALRHLDVIQLSTVQQDMQFTRLSLYMNLANRTMFTNVASKLAGLGFPSFGALTVNIRLKHCKMDDMPELLNLLLEDVARVPGLQYFGLCCLCPHGGDFVTANHKSCPGQFKSQRNKSPDLQNCPMLCNWLSQIEHGSVASRFFKGSRTLRYVALEVRPCDHKYWTIARTPEAGSDSAIDAVVPVVDNAAAREHIDQYERYTLELYQVADLIRR